MSDKTYTYPTFELPDARLNFMASERTLYDYGHLYGFCSRFKMLTSGYEFTERHPLALVSKSSDKLSFVIAACYLLKIPFLPLNPDLTDAELESQIAQAKPAAFYTDQKNELRLKGKPIITVPDSAMSIISTGRDIVSPSSDPQREFGLFFTSGSTGRPKLVPLKRRQILFATHASAGNFRPEPNRYWLLCLPLNHIGGISIILRSLLYGSAIFRMNQFDEHQIRNFLSENRLFQVASLVPTMLLRLLEDPLFQLHLDFKAMLLGGGPVTEGLIDKSLERGIPIVSSYGMTETCAQISANPMLQPRGIYHPKKSVGSVFAPNQCQIRDPENGRVLPPNEVGELWLSGPQIIDRYLDDTLTKKAFDEQGWFNTGDIGHLNRRGQLFIQTRRSGRIVTGGENVDPLEVEAAISRIEGVAEAAVTGIPDTEWGQKVVALIVLNQKENTVTKSQIISELKQKISGFKIPKEIRLVESLPKTSLGKLKRNELPDFFS